MGKYQKNIEAARRISVMQYLQTYHPGELVRKTDKEYCTKTHSSLVITPANGLFHWFSQSKGGNNALDYLVKVEGMCTAISLPWTTCWPLYTGWNRRKFSPSLRRWNFM